MYVWGEVACERSDVGRRVKVLPEQAGCRLQGGVTYHTILDVYGDIGLLERPRTNNPCGHTLVCTSQALFQM